jgi:hypothetical protein
MAKATELGFRAVLSISTGISVALTLVALAFALDGYFLRGARLAQWQQEMTDMSMTSCFYALLFAMLGLLTCAAYVLSGRGRR